MKTNDDKTADGLAHPPSGESVMISNECHRLTAEAAGFWELGLLDEAEGTLRKMTALGPDARDEAEAALCCLLLEAGRLEEVVTLGRGLFERRLFDDAVVTNTALALHHLDRLREARETFGLLERCGVRLEDEAYQMACFASRLGEFPEVLRLLNREFERSTEYHATVLGDTDFIPFWAWLENHEFTPPEAHLMIETRWKDVCAASRDPRRPILLSHSDRAILTDRAKRLFRFSRTEGYFALIPSAVAADPRAYGDLVKTRAQAMATIEEIIRRAHERAADVVLAAQPRYAAEHAAWGNHLGARYHIDWGLRHKPALIVEFLKHPGLELMKPLLNELLFTERDDPEFLKRMHAVLELTELDPAAALELLEETPEVSRTTAFYRLRLASLLWRMERYEEALPIALQVCALWPNDAAPYDIAAVCLTKLNRKDDARSLLEAAPACYRRFRNYRERIIDAGGEAPKVTAPAPRRFRGHPDLGGILIAKSEKPAKRVFISALRARPDTEGRALLCGPALENVTRGHVSETGIYPMEIFANKFWVTDVPMRAEDSFGYASTEEIANLLDEGITLRVYDGPYDTRCDARCTRFDTFPEAMEDL